VQHFEFSRASFKLSSPARKSQELVPVRDLNQPVGGGWSSTHQLAGLPIVVHLSTTADNARAFRTRAGPVAQKFHATQLPQHNVLVEAVRSGSTVECWGRVQEDLGLYVPVLGKSPLVEGAFARKLSCRLIRRGKGSARRIPTIGARAPADDVPALPDTSFDNPKFKEQLLSLHNRLPGDVDGFYRDGIRPAPNKVPRCVMGIYRRGLNCVLELLLKEADEEAVPSLWRLFLMYDGLIRTLPEGRPAHLSYQRESRPVSGGRLGPSFQRVPPVPRPVCASSTNRCPLSPQPSRRQGSTSSTERAQQPKPWKRSVGAASALRANPFPASLAAGDVTASFGKLNPQAGGDVPRPSEVHFVCGP